jgi:outer membrane protein assembly factor BamB
MNLKHYFAAVCAVLALPILSGCGGGSSTGLNSGASTKSAVGSATFTITWPKHTTRLIPAASNSINVVVSLQGNPYTSQLVAKPTTGNTSTVTFNVLPVGNLTISATAYPNSDGTGVAQAAASAPLAIQPGKVTNFSLTMASTIKTVKINPIFTLWTNSALPITAAAYDANNNLVLTAPASWGWKSATTSVATVGTGTNTPQVSGLSVGTSVLTATEGESGVTGTYVVTVAAPGLASTTRWVKYQGNAQNTGYSSGTGATGVSKWSFAAGSPTYSAEVIGQDGTIYFGSSNGALYALNPDGSQKWMYQTNGQASCPVIGNDGSIYFGSGDGHVYSLTSDGTLRWSTATVSGIYSNPAMASDGTIYACSYKGTVNAIDGLTGTSKWTFLTGNYIFASPAIGKDGTVYVGCDNPTANISSPSNLFYAINPDGSQKWQYGGAFGFDSAAAIGSNGTVYVGTNDGGMHALDPATGRDQWSYTTTSGPNTHPSAPAIAPDGTVYFGATDGNLYAFTSQMSLKWTTAIGGNYVVAPAVGGDGTIYTGFNDNSGNGGYAAVNPDGSVKWTFATNGEVNGASAIGPDGIVYTAVYNGIIAIK